MDLTNPVNLLIAGIYFLFVGVLTIFSLFSIYVLLRYAQSRLLALVVCGVYAFFFLTILAQSYQTLTTIK